MSEHITTLETKKKVLFSRGLLDTPRRKKQGNNHPSDSNPRSRQWQEYSVGDDVITWSQKTSKESQQMNIMKPN